MRINKAHTKLIANKSDDLVSIVVNKGSLEGTTFNGTTEIMLRSDLELFNNRQQSDFRALNGCLVGIEDTAKMEHYTPKLVHRDYIKTNCLGIASSRPDNTVIELLIDDEHVLLQDRYSHLILKHGFTLTKPHTRNPRLGIFKDSEFIGVVGVIIRM